MNNHAPTPKGIYAIPPERRLAYIVVATEGEGLKLLERCKAGESFETLAKQASMDRTSAVHGGRIGWIKKGDILVTVATDPACTTVFSIIGGVVLIIGATGVFGADAAGKADGCGSAAPAAGIDIARESVARAELLKGQRPIDYKVGHSAAALGSTFHFAFSHEVLYLLPDLAAHAADIKAALRPGGAYIAAMGCHKDSAVWSRWRKLISETSSIPIYDHSLDSVAKAFGVPINHHPDVVERFKKRFGADVNEARLRMARIPDGGVLIDNPVSKAPGFMVGNVFVLEIGRAHV